MRAPSDFGARGRRGAQLSRSCDPIFGGETSWDLLVVGSDSWRPDLVAEHGRVPVDEQTLDGSLMQQLGRQAVLEGPPRVLVVPVLPGYRLVTDICQSKYGRRKTPTHAI